MEKETLAELTRWGQKGYAVTLRYGIEWRQEGARVGWICAIYVLATAIGTASALTPRNPEGFHPTSALEAARDALRQAAVRWPEMVGGSL